MYDENTMAAEIEGFDGTWTCTDSAYHNHEWLYEMSNDDTGVMIIVTEDGELYEDEPQSLNQYLEDTRAFRVLHSESR